MRLAPNLISFLGGATVAAGSIVTALWAQHQIAQMTSNSLPEAQATVISVGAGVVLMALALLKFSTPFVKESNSSSGVLEGNRKIDAESVALQKQFSRFLALVKEGLANSERYGNSLDVINKRLQSVSSDAIVQTIILDLMQSNELYRRQSVELERRLGEARAQAEQLQERARHAEKLASVDPLTGIANRRKFDSELQRLVALSHEENTPLCLVMVDIDHFKAVNDEFGHRAGDTILGQFAELLSATVRATDVVARYGGEEFTMILPRAPLGNGYEIAERARAAVQAKTWANFERSGQLKLTASFGIADIREGEHPTDLIKRADAKLYEAKANGRNRVAMWGSAE